jgi:hypothetical protein
MFYYIYAHYRNDTGEVFYVGKGEGNRHKSKQGRNPYWHNIVKSHGYISKILQYFEKEEDAHKAEQELIAERGRKDLGKGLLVNMSDGGEGASGAVRTPEQRQRYSESTWMNTEAGKASMRGDLNPAKRDDVRAILSERNAHRDPGVREKGAATFRAMGDAHPSKGEKHRAMMREMNPSKEPLVRAKISQSRMGQPSWNTGLSTGPMSDEQKVKIGESSKRAWEAKKASGGNLFSDEGLVNVKESTRLRSIRKSKGTYVTPQGLFALISEAAAANTVSTKTITKNCLGYSRDGKSYLPKVGWSFMPKGQDDGASLSV